MALDDSNKHTLIAVASGFRLTLFGRFALVDPSGQLVTGLGRKSRGIIAYLALNRPAARRELLAELFWGDREVEQARASLRQACYDMKNCLHNAPGLLVFTHDQISLDRPNLRTDVDELDRKWLDRDVIIPLLDFERRELLADLTNLSPHFDDWLAIERVRRRDERRAASLNCARDDLNGHLWSDAEHVASLLLALDPTDQNAVEIALQSRAHAGDQRGAQALFGRHAEALRRLLDIQPAASTSALLGACGTGDEDAASLHPAGEIDKRHALSTLLNETPRRLAMPALMKMSVLSQTARKAVLYTCVAAILGLSINLAHPWSALSTTADSAARVTIRQLSIPDGDNAAAGVNAALRTVIVRHLAGSNTPVEIVENEPSTDTPHLTLRGNSQTYSGEIRTNLELVSNPKGQVIWAENFRRPVREIDQFADQIGLQIARQLNCAYSHGREPFFNSDLEFARLTLAHCDAIGNDFTESVRLDEEITRRAPTFARGWSEFAMDTALVGSSQSAQLRKASFRRAMKYSNRALALDPHQGLAYSAQGVSIADTSPWRVRDKLARRGLGADPTNPELHSRVVKDFASIGRLQDAMGEAILAYRYDHFFPGKPLSLAAINRVSGDFDAAWDWVLYSRRYWPDHPWFQDEAVRLGIDGGHSAETLQLIRAGRIGLSANRKPMVVRFLEWRIKPTWANQMSAMRAIVDETSRRGVDDEKIQMLAMLGRNDEAFRMGTQLPIGSNPGIDWFLPELAAFRADPRFTALAARLGLIKIWKDTGLSPDFCAMSAPPPACRQIVLGRPSE